MNGTSSSGGPIVSSAYRTALLAAAKQTLKSISSVSIPDWLVCKTIGDSGGLSEATLNRLAATLVERLIEKPLFNELLENRFSDAKLQEIIGATAQALYAEYLYIGLRTDDSEATQRWYLHIARKVLVTVKSKSDVAGNEQLIFDIFHDVTTKLLKYEVEKPASYLAFINTTVVNTTIDWQRRQNKTVSGDRRGSDSAYTEELPTILENTYDVVSSNYVAQIEANNLVEQFLIALMQSLCTGQLLPLQFLVWIFRCYGQAYARPTVPTQQEIAEALEKWRVNPHFLFDYLAEQPQVDPKLLGEVCQLLDPSQLRLPAKFNASRVRDHLFHSREKVEQLMLSLQ